MDAAQCRTLVQDKSTQILRLSRDNICKETGVYITRYVYQLCPSHESSFLIITSCLQSLVYRVAFEFIKLYVTAENKMCTSIHHYRLVRNMLRSTRAITSITIISHASIQPAQPLQTMHNFTRLLKETHADRRVSIQAARRYTYLCRFMLSKELKWKCADGYEFSAVAPYACALKPYLCNRRLLNCSARITTHF